MLTKDNIKIIIVLITENDFIMLKVMLKNTIYLK